MGGYAIMYCNGAVDWGASNLKIVPDSSNEAEAAVGSRAAKAMLFTRALCHANRRKVHSGTPMLGDNKSLFEQVQQEGASARTRYYERAILLLKRTVLLLITYPYLVTTDNMLADVFTKATDKGTFTKMRGHLMNINSSLRGEIAKSMRHASGELKRIISRMSRY